MAKSRQSEPPAEIKAAPATGEKLRYSCLDGMRGIAALSVVIYHFGQNYGHNWPPHAYLAVDLFFLLSGFVIALSYTDRLITNVSWKDFMIKRLIRLYPLYLIGAVIGICFMAVQVLRYHANLLPIGYLSTDSIFTLFLIPTPAPFTPFIPAPLFPFNGPSWTLFFEIIANFLFAIILFRLATKWLFCICLLSGLYLCASIGGPVWFNGGAAWETVDLGALRMLYSFPLGILLWRWLPSRQGRERWIALATLILIGFVLCLAVSVQWRTYYELSIVLIIFPLLLIAGQRFELPDLVKPIFLFLGDISYTIYAIHWPLINCFVFVIGRAHVSDVISLAVFMACLITVGYVTHTFVDIPVRRQLSKKWRHPAVIAIDLGPSSVKH